MNLKLVRHRFDETGIYGILSNDNISLATLEHAYLNSKQQYEPKLYAGTFLCVKGQHQLAHMTQPFTTFEITKVTGHTNILLHVGNTNKDSDGCVLLGGLEQADEILHSKLAFDKFMDLMKNVNQFTLTVIDDKE